MHNNLERLIKQTVPFKSEKLKAELGVLYLSSFIHNQQQQFFKKYGISPQQYNVLRILRGQYPKGININAIKERMLDKMSDVSRIADRLCKINLIVKQLNMLDKRNADITISDKGLNLLKEIDAVENDSRSLMQHLDPGEMDHFNQLIDKLLSTL